MAARRACCARPCAGVPPDSVLDRKKTPYPATQDPVRAGHAQGGRELPRNHDAPVRPLLDLEKARALATRPTGTVSRAYDRGSLEMALWLNRWLESSEVLLDL